MSNQVIPAEAIQAVTAERDELVAVIDGSAIRLITGEDELDTYHVADAILAAGYRKPLTSEGDMNEAHAQQAGDQAVGTMPSMLAVPANKDMDAPTAAQPTFPAKAVNEAQKAYIALSAEADYRTPDEYVTAILEAAAPHMLATVSTFTELDALPRFTVIRSEEGAVFERQTMWHEAGSRDPKYSRDISLPATVLQLGWGEE